eukprot:TRINITY_DN8245_c0_g1_i1.p1 TRINITY_DN8245_c0_g1~~TRINITY_DN8245_c0_g1_i1.p1  ORF type:complete len:684 (+),score=199.45 TRINITY_DN8245_c0_g1_i1:38-2089(+)
MAYVSSDELPKKFDVIVYGTGLTESIIAAALSRNGVSVLHLDANQFYGGESASLMYREFMEFLEEIPATRPANVESVQSELSTSDTQRYFLQSSFPMLYENVEQEFVEQLVQPEPTVATEQLIDVTSKQDNTGEVSSANGTAVDTQEDTAGSTQPNTAVTEDIENSSAPETNTPTQPVIEGNNTTTVIQESITTQDGDISHSTQPDTTVTEVVENNSTQESDPPAQDTDTRSPYVPSPPSFPKPSTDPVLSWTELKSQYRTFTFDLFPKLIYATDPFVDTIVKSSVTKYLEFKAVNKIVTVLDGSLTVVPASRADVFTSKTVSVLEKRLLMRFVTFVMELDRHTDETQQYNSRPFLEFMEHMGLNAKLKSLIKSSIAQVEDDTMTEVALERSQFYLQSIGRYSNSPYLWPVYGIGELPQAFCRMSAVFGGLYMLRKEIWYLELVERDGVKTCSSVCDAENTTFLCNHIVLAASLLPDTRPTARYSRAILVTNRKLLPPGNTDIKSDIGFVTIPAHTLGADQPHTIKVIELCSSSQSCPNRCCLVHITSCSHQNTAKADLLPAVEFLFHTASDASDHPPTPKLLYSLYFNYNSTQVSGGHRCTPADNVHVISSPNLDPSYQQILSEAQSVFDTICPGDLFLPPPPDPEDIIYEPATPEDDTVENGEDSNQSPEDGNVAEQTDID